MRRIIAPLIGFLALAGLADSVYLVLQHLGMLNSPPFMVASACEMAEGACKVADRTDVGSVFGIPAPFLGGLYFAAIVVMVVLRLHRAHWLLPRATLIFFGAGLGYSGYLLYMMAAVLEEPCPYCLAAHSINVAVFVLFALSLHFDMSSRPSLPPLRRGDEGG
jgi:uncharacterized membrane protein